MNDMCVPIQAIPLKKILLIFLVHESDTGAYKWSLRTYCVPDNARPSNQKEQHEQRYEFII